MKKILIALAATTALAAAAAPAAAQSWRGDNDHRDNGRGYASAQRTTSYVDGLEWKITNAAQERRISRGEAREMLADLRRVQPIAWRVQSGQASGWERQLLNRTVNRIEQALNDRGRHGWRDDRRDDWRDDRRDDWRDDRRDDRTYGSGYGGNPYRR